MKIYLASRYGRRLELAGYADTIRRHGHEVTSRWLSGSHGVSDNALTHADAERFAGEDLDDILAADAIVCFTEAPGPTAGRGRGGRYFEMGFAHGVGKRVVVIGPLENVFCHIEAVTRYDTFEDFLFFEINVPLPARAEDLPN